MDTFTLLLVATGAFLLAGTIKGVAGLGLPSAAIALMTLFLDPRSAIALVLFPMVGSNFWQFYRGGNYIETIKRYWVFAVCLFWVVLLTAYGTQNVNDRWILLALGLAILLFVAVSWKDWMPRIKPEHDRMAQIGFGAASGVIGGMTAGWGAPLAMYMMAKDLEKDEFVGALGFLIVAGSIPLLYGYIQIGFVDLRMSLISIAMLIPTILGFTLGEHLRRRLSTQSFRKVLLILFVLLAANLLRRAIWYH